MKVYELIQALQQMPQDADVYKHDSEWGFQSAKCVEPVRLKRDKVNEPELDPKAYYWEDYMLGYVDEDNIYFQGVTLR